MSLLKNYYFDLYHRDVDPIVTGSSMWGVQGEYVIDAEHFGYTNWVSDEGDLQTLTDQALIYRGSRRSGFGNDGLCEFFRSLKSGLK